MTPQDDLERDARLQAALRHAPDRDLLPPAAISDHILARARATAHDDAPAAGWLARAWGWLARPATAGALGSLMVAGVVGWMWRVGPPDDNLERAGRPAAELHASAPAAGAASGPSPATPVEEPAGTPAARPPAPRPSPVPASPPAPPPPPAPVRTSPPATATAPAAAPSHEAADGVAKSAAPLPVPAAPASPATQAAAPAAARALRERAVSAESGRARLSAAPAAAFDPLLPALLALDPQADHALRQRLQRLQARVGGPWVEAPPLAAGAGQEIRGADGRLLGRLLVDGDGLWWLGSDGLSWRAPLGPDTAPR